MPVTVDIPSAAAVTGWVAVVGLGFKIYYDGITTRSGKSKSEAEASKANADSDTAQATALAAASTTAAQWMDRYAQVLKDLGEISGKVRMLESNVEALTMQVKTLSNEKDGLQAALNVCQEDLRQEQALRKKAEEGRDEYKQGFNSAMLLLQGAAESRTMDPAYTNVAEATIKRVLDYDAKQNSHNESHG